MAIPIAAAAAGAALLGNAGNAIATMHTNKKQRQHAEKMYNIQRQHALDDWDRTNAYNTPQAQMQRLKEAGLNPNLVYGNGATTAFVYYGLEKLQSLHHSRKRGWG